LSAAPATRPTSARTEILHERYARPIFRYCLRHLRSREEAEDAAQIVFLNAHRSLERGIEPRSEQAWLFKIAEHVVLYRRRTIARRARVEFPVDIDSLADVVEAPAQNGDSTLLRLPEALARIPEAERKAIVLREWHGLSYREVAAELGVSTSAAETLIFRGRRRLAEELRALEPKRRRSRLGFFSGLTSLKWLLGGGTSVKTVAGVTSVAVIAAVPVTHVLREGLTARATVALPSAAAPTTDLPAHAPMYIAPRAAAHRRVAKAKPAPAAPPAPAPKAAPGPAPLPAPAPAAPPPAEGRPVPESVPVPDAAPAAEPARDPEVAVTADAPTLPSLPPDELAAAAAESAPTADVTQVSLASPPEEAAPPVAQSETVGPAVDVAGPDPSAVPERDPAGYGANDTPGVPRQAYGDPFDGARPDPAAGAPTGGVHEDGLPPGLEGKDVPPGQVVQGGDASGRGAAQRLEHHGVDLAAVVDALLQVLDPGPGSERRVAEPPEPLFHFVPERPLER
jgi:RNA polymerase sigma-70 factor (ECF subfamily)